MKRDTLIKPKDSEMAAPQDMIRSCETCAAWCVIGQSLHARKIVYDDRVEIIPPGVVGYCLAEAPTDDFKWPRTMAFQRCAKWESACVEANLPSGEQGAVRNEKQNRRSKT